MQFIGFLICFPLIAALILALVKNDNIRRIVVKVSSLAIIFATLYYATQNFFITESHFYLKETKIIDNIILAVEAIIACYIIYLGIIYKKYIVSILSVIQTGLMMWLELGHGKEAMQSNHLYVDKLSIIMSVIIAVVGCLICVYALGYMKNYHIHHKEYNDRSPYFFALLFVFLSAMFGLVFSNNLVWLYFFWEITTLVSFLLIGYTQTKESITNSFRALWMNLIGGLAFAIAIVYCELTIHSIDLNVIIKLATKYAAHTNAFILPITLLALAALIKSAQLPFSKWLLGAMVAPTPTSALLHSATMVKAGVYLLIRLSPALHGNIIGLLVGLIGGFTFLATSLLAISQSDAKKVLAYSTIANLGLICACAGIGTHEAVWAATLLVIFHAVSKSLMFLSVGAFENSTGTRNIEDMHGLIVLLPELAFVMIVGIAGMFLAPFGMLISKWAALKAFVDSGNIILILFLVFGSAATLFYWTKWLGKLVAVLPHSERRKNTIKGNEWFSLISHATIMLALCVLFPVISKYLIVPFISDMFGSAVPVIISEGNVNIMIFELCMIVILPIAIRFLTFNKKEKIVTTYMNGVNTGNAKEFVDSFGQNKKIYISNWYMDSYFGEKRLLLPSIVLSSAFVVLILAIVIGGALA